MEEGAALADVLLKRSAGAEEPSEGAENSSAPNRSLEAGWRPKEGKKRLGNVPAHLDNLELELNQPLPKDNHLLDLNMLEMKNTDMLEPCHLPGFLKITEA